MSINVDYVEAAQLIELVKGMPMAPEVNGQPALVALTQQQVVRLIEESRKDYVRLDLVPELVRDVAGKSGDEVSELIGQVHELRQTLLEVLASGGLIAAHTIEYATRNNNAGSAVDHLQLVLRVKKDAPSAA